MARPPIPGSKLPPPPLPGRRPARRGQQPYVAVSIAILALSFLLLAVLGIAVLSNPNPNSEAGSNPEPVATQPLGGPPFQMPESAGGVAPAPAPGIALSPDPGTAAPVEPAPTVTVRGSAQDVIAGVKPSVVLVIAARDEEIGSGSGFVVSNTQVATCNHVVEGASRLVVITSDGRQNQAVVTASDPDRDLAVLTCSGPLPQPLTLGDASRVRDGDEIAVTGFPVVAKFLDLGYEPAASTSRGTISASRRRELAPGVETEELQIDAAINAGNSGGPVYSSRDGTVVGVASSKLAQEQNIGFAVSVNALRRLMGR